MPRIILKFESAVIKEMPIITNSLTVGRKPDNDLVINHPAVSGHHCKISLQGDTYFVEDLNSTNGTLVNDKKIIKAGIHNGDTVSIARHTLSFIDDRVPAAAAPATGAPAQAQTTAPKAPPQPPAQPSDPELEAQKPIPVASGTPKKVFEKTGGLRVTEGVVDSVDYLLIENSTYIGKSDRVTVKIKGMLAPEVAAMINRKADSYVLVAIKEGYPKVNGMPVQKERQLNEGDVIEVGGTKMQFYLVS